MTELYLVRHGETELNAKGVYYGWTDCSLNDRGRKQAEELSGALKEIRFDTVLSSSLQRAVETAVIISGYGRERIITDDRLRELNFGAWEGMHFEEVRERHREAWENWGRDWKASAPPKGESYRALYGRVKACVLEALEKHPGEKLLLVAHQGCLRIIPLILLGLSDDYYWSFTAEQGKYSLYELDEKGCCIIRKINCI